MELQQAASSLRLLCVKRGKENQLLLQALRGYEKEIFNLRANELLLQKEIAMWGSYYRLFAQPLFSAGLLLERCRCEAQQQQLISKFAHERGLERKTALGAKEKLRRKNTALLAQLQEAKKQQEESRKAARQMETQLKNALEDFLGARGKVLKLQSELEMCTNRLEKSEVERERAQRHLSAHVAALEKLDQNSADVKLYDEEIGVRDVVIAQLQQTVRELNEFIAQKLSSRLEGSTDCEISTAILRQLKQRSLNSQRSKTNECCCPSERLHRSIERLRKQLGEDGSLSAEKQRCFSVSYKSPRLSVTPDLCSFQLGKQNDGIGVDLQEFLAQELRASLP